MAKKSKAAEAVQSPTIPSISQDLQDKVSALKAISLTHRLLNEGCFPRVAAEGIERSIAFLTALHKQVLTDAQAHPDAHLIPELSKQPSQSEE